MNPFDLEFETITLLKQLCEQTTENEELLGNLRLLKIQQDICLDFLNLTIKELQKDEQRTEKRISELACIIENRNRSSNSYHRDIHKQEENK